MTTQKDIGTLILGLILGAAIFHYTSPWHTIILTWLDSIGWETIILFTAMGLVGFYLGTGLLLGYLLHLECKGVIKINVKKITLITHHQETILLLFFWPILISFLIMALFGWIPDEGKK